MSYQTWKTTSTAYQAYQAASQRCAEAFAPKADRTEEFLTIFIDYSLALEDRPAKYAKPGLKALVQRLKARDTMAIAGIDPSEVHLTDAEWDKHTAQLGLVASCVGY
ncbi:hypothetical protein [Glycomyces tenuis]|uniref:hypothetical protein n=1 Tax=Glycomyces tenuis TaxID=58116 RepID=UPI0003FC8AF4|nr:hypothetical protein [Glycomyces tenuis]